MDPGMYRQNCLEHTTFQVYLINQLSRYIPFISVQEACTLLLLVVAVRVASKRYYRYVDLRSTYEEIGEGFDR